jgi:type IV secretory pathway TrbD component
MPKQPVVTVNNPVGAAVARTAGQGISGAFIVDGLLAFNVDLTDRQTVWLTAAFGISIAAVQNLIERWRGRRLIGISA